MRGLLVGQLAEPARQLLEPLGEPLELAARDQTEPRQELGPDLGQLRLNAALQLARTLVEGMALPANLELFLEGAGPGLEPFTRFPHLLVQTPDHLAEALEGSVSPLVLHHLRPPS